ncbi:MAG: alpha-1,2-fucosyltransferase [Clostridiales bacterium]|nr:alpha-1,2-fucosyltransferase [Clostridiales bacterium]
MILTDLHNGLGNQLFRYAFTRAIQEEAGGCTVYFSRELCERSCRDAGMVMPEFLFDYYNLLPGRTVVLDGKIPLLLALIYRKCFRLLFPREPNGLTREQFAKRVKAGYISSFDEECLCDDVSQLPVTSKLNYIDGYFQWPDAFLHLRDKLRAETSLKVPLSESEQPLLQEIKSCESVCLHVRRGDYLEDEYASFLDICHYQYYKEAMEYIAEKVENPLFYVFSNDIDWVEKNYEIPYPHKFVKGNHIAPFELELMRNCKHFIIANSTFSWWAQFLAENESAVVVAPRPWFGDGRQCSLYLPHWHTIDPLAGGEPGGTG